MASRLLSERGARVIKIEQPGVGDYYRAILPQGSHLGGGSFNVLHAGHESLVLNLKYREGAGLLLKMVKNADVVLESFRPGTLSRLGLSYSKLKKVNPRIILCSITGYGQKGERSSLAGHDLNFLARTGLIDLLDPKRSLIPDFQIVDLTAGYLAVNRILEALLVRKQTRRGAWIDVSMEAAGLSLSQVYRDPQHYYSPSPLGGGLFRYGVYESCDGWVALGALEPKFWNHFCEVIERPDWQASGFDLGLSENSSGPTKEALSAIFKTRSSQEWEMLGRAHDLCLTAVYRLDDVVFSDAKQKAPLLGEHTDRILKRIGYGKMELKSFRSMGVIA